MDDHAALIARRVAMAAAAWFNAPADVESYRRLAEAVMQRSEYCAPALDAATVDEVLDDLADVSPPIPLAQGVVDLEAMLRRQARREL